MPPVPACQTNDGWLFDTMRAARAGDDDALGALLEAFRPYLLLIADGAADAVPPAKDAPSDLVASAVRRAVGDFDQFRGESPAELAGWLRGILLNHISDVGRRYRADKRHAGREVSLDTGGYEPRLRDQLAAPDASPDRGLLLEEEARRVRAALERLPGPYAQVLLLRQRDGLSFEDVGLRLGRSADSARKLFGRALKQFCAALEMSDGA
jgi:RNA polymerase sigma-70 factor (ECF subfamily)